MAKGWRARADRTEQGGPTFWHVGGSLGEFVYFCLRWTHRRGFRLGPSASCLLALTCLCVPGYMHRARSVIIANNWLYTQQAAVHSRQTEMVWLESQRQGVA